MQQEEIEWGEIPTDLTKAFWEFHNANPHVLERLKNLACELQDRGRQRIGIGMLFEVLRWEHYMSTTGECFKLNNNYRAFYSRLLESRVPRLQGTFTKRASCADSNCGEAA